MAIANALVHGEGLLKALTETALEVQRAKGVGELLLAAGSGLETLGFDVVLLSSDETGFRVRYLSARPYLEALKKAVLPDDRKPFTPPKNAAVLSEEPVLLTSARHAMASVCESAGSVLPEGILEQAPQMSVVAPLRLRDARWGSLVLLHQDLRQEDLASIRLFSLQLGSAIEFSHGLACLDRRTVELELVHELARFGSGVDSRALGLRALEIVCRTTQSDLGALYRFDAESGDFVLVGDAYGCTTPVTERFRDAQHVLAQSSVAGSVRSMPTGAQWVLAEGMAQVAVVPLRIEGTWLGLITLARARDVAYGEHDLRSVEILGGQVASQLERARLYDEANRLYGNLKASYDELARAQQELVRHERFTALGELAAVMAHEVRNPLGVIFNSLSTLKRLLRPTGDSEMLLNMVGEEADRLNRIVGDLLDFVRPYEVTKKSISVESIVANAVEAAAAATAYSRIRVVTELPADLPEFPLDAHLLKQVLLNLVVNAAQSMPRGGTVTVSASVDSVGGAPWLVLQVRDEGVGLSPKASEKMFQPFFTTKAMGTGLGLAVVKRIVDAHHGEIAARSNEGGPGTTFTLRLPSTLDSGS